MQQQYEKKIKAFKQIFIAFEALLFLQMLASFFVTKETMPQTLLLPFLAIIPLLWILGITLMVMMYKVSRVLKNEGLMSVWPGFLIFLQFFLNISIGSIVIPIYLWVKTEELKQKDALSEGQPVSPRPSFGVTLIGIWFMVSFALTTFAYVNPHNTYTSFMTLADTVIAIISSAAYAVCGLYLLRLDDRARKATMVLAVAGMAWIVIGFSPQINPEKTQRYEASFRQMMLEQEKEQEQELRDRYGDEAKVRQEMRVYRQIFPDTIPAQVMFYFTFAASLFWCGILCFFLTRPAVRKQFQNTQQ